MYVLYYYTINTPLTTKWVNHIKIDTILVYNIIAINGNWEIANRTAGDIFTTCNLHAKTITGNTNGKYSEIKLTRSVVCK